MLRALSKLALLHKMERGIANSDDAWKTAEAILNSDPCDDWPVINIGGNMELMTWNMLICLPK